MSAFEHLHPAIQHHIVNSLGWQALRKLQEEAIEPILNGKSALLIAPTAGGKTEAAIFPLLSRLISDNWSPISVLYVCPIKALLNNLETRLRQYSDWLGRRVALWHGDIGQGERQRITGCPPDILLATPESLEVMLVSRRTDHATLFENVRAVVIDEIHAFAGDDRGWHLVAVLDRIACLSAHRLQRVGLSATVGNPKALIGWLEGRNDSEGLVISPVEPGGLQSDVKVDYVGSLNNAAIVVSRLYRGEKRLVFCDSRSQVESLAAALRQLGVQTFVSHSSLSVDERRRAEKAFSESRNCVIVATSTLELGIDVGDLDRVIQLDAPPTVAAFLQRLGRTGRRMGTTRNCLFLATTENALIRTLGLLELWSQGYVEPVIPPQKPYPILAQQLMTLCLQQSGIGIHIWLDWLRGFCHSAHFSAEESDQLVAHMLQSGYLFEDQGILCIGQKGEKRFGRRNYMELFSVFDSPPLFTVFYGRTELGSVHPLTFQVRRDSPISLSLAGHSWLVKYVDWKRCHAYVEPGKEPGKSRWFSQGQALAYELCKAILLVLTGAVPKVSMSQRALAAREAVLTEYEWADTGHTSIMSDENGASWWTFGGGLLNSAIASKLTARLDSVAYDNFAVRFKGRQSVEDVARSIRMLLRDESNIAPPISEEVRERYKFGECVPASLLDKMIASRFACLEQWKEIRKRRLQIVIHHGKRRT
ncbi:MAG: DEAD/DEAH box helicase [Gammaproteobacteria bacterium]